jgi:transposase
MNPNNQTYDINHRDKLYYTMGGNIPVKTKHKVLKLWLSGVSRKKIAEKVGIGEGTVTSIVQEVAETLLKYGCSINALPEVIAEKQVELMELQEKIGSLETARLELLNENELTEKEIYDYSRDKPLVETIKGLREEISDLNAGAMQDKVRILELESKWHVGPFVPENMTSEEIEEAARLLLYNAADLEKEIKYIQKKAPHLPYTIHGPRFANQDP